MSAVLMSSDLNTGSASLVRDSALDYLTGRGGLKHARSGRFSAHGYDRKSWKQICQMGWPGTMLPEMKGGSGMSAVEAVEIAMAAGHFVAPEPVIAAMAVADLLDGEDLSSHLVGDRVYLPAWQEHPNTLHTGGMTKFDGVRVTGRKQFVWQGSSANVYVVSTDAGVVLVEAGAAGLTVESLATQDGGHWATLELENVSARGIDASMDDAIEHMSLLEAAYLFGTASAAFSMTLDYMSARKQFGKLIGSFQALQHRAADLQIALALAEASVRSAANVLAYSEDQVARKASVSRAKARASETALLVTRQAVQMHGAIGYTDEYDVGLYLRSAMCHASMMGSASLHRERYAKLCL